MEGLTAEQEAQYKEVFNMVDTDGGGSIDAEELARAFQAMGSPITEQQAEEMINSVDEDATGAIEFDEFVQLMQQQSSNSASAGKELPMEELEDLRSGTAFTIDQIRRLHRRFVALDEDGDGSISYTEFQKWPAIGENPLLKRVIDIFDVDGDETVDMKEFVRALAIFSHDDRLEKLKFTFRIYDFDADGWISNADLFKTIKVMVEDNLTEEEIQETVDKTFIECDANKDGLISWDEFKHACEKQNFGDMLKLQF
eukprot:NODE_1193_length_960_cov_88.518607_g1148_i0.p1 GENE.NODE_1193_length_960_cov_88.518607_g1148_i0~~NODE_1193_length_960_cov_88.518607_g1148_i0.p1  ORF type:complete len:255 (-),score=67.88 NODE_1193_length_960_cov_88.518607_g1148_i0:46-810(-)